MVLLAGLDKVNCNVGTAAYDVRPGIRVHSTMSQ